MTDTKTLTAATFLAALERFKMDYPPLFNNSYRVEIEASL